MIALFTGAGTSFSQSFTINWENTIGGGEQEELYDMSPTDDGGYILAGTSRSNTGDDKSQDNFGGTDGWVVKIDAMGAVEWEAAYGDDNFERIHSIIQTNDGGYIFNGFGVGDDDTYGYGDYWVVKLNASGQVEWDSLYGTDDRETGVAILQTADNGYIVGGTRKADDLSSENLWVFKLNASGEIQWEQTYNNALDEFASIDTTSDGGYVIGAVTSFPKEDYWIIKTDQDGNVEWDTVFGGIGDDRLRVVKQTMDGGYVLGGHSDSPSQANCVSDCFWIVKTDDTGNLEWENTIGGDGTDLLYSLEQTTDGGYVLGGSVASNASIHTDVSEYQIGRQDYWFVKLNDAGVVSWDRRLGGEQRDVLRKLIQVEDNIYVLAGNSVSSETEHKSEINYGGGDFWVLEVETGPPFLEITTPNGGEVFDKSEDFSFQWETSLPDGPGIELELFYSADGGATFESWRTLDDNNGRTIFSVPFQWDPGNNYMIKITSNGLEDVTDGTFEITDGNTSTNSLASQNWKLHPNPAQDELHLELAGKEGMLVFYSLTGKKIFSHKVNGKATLDISDVAPGLYLYELLHAGENLHTGKIIIE